MLADNCLLAHRSIRSRQICSKKALLNVHEIESLCAPWDNRDHFDYAKQTVRNYQQFVKACKSGELKSQSVD